MFFQTFHVMRQRPLCTCSVRVGAIANAETKRRIQSITPYVCIHLTPSSLFLPRPRRQVPLGTRFGCVDCRDHKQGHTLHFHLHQQPHPRPQPRGCREAKAQLPGIKQSNAMQRYARESKARQGKARRGNSDGRKATNLTSTSQGPEEQAARPKQPQGSKCHKQQTTTRRRCNNEGTKER